MSKKLDSQHQQARTMGAYTQHVTWKTRSTEATLTEDDQWMVTLKSGMRVDGRNAFATWKDLQIEVEQAPETLKHLIDLVIHGTELPAGLADSLGQSYFARGAIRPVVHGLIQSGMTMDGEDIAIINPFKSDPKTHEILNRVERVYRENASAFIRRIRSNSGPDSQRSL